jgi:UDP-glucose 4-epimerase
MRIIVFGGAGFLGSHLADVLTERGHQVVVFDLKRSPYCKKGQESVVGDILDQEAVDRAVRGADAVYTYAGIADMEEAKNNPLETVKRNILGTAIILEACRQNQVKRILFASTLYVYSKAGSFYRSSKQACELLIENYHEIYGLDFTILRYGSLYGPRANSSNWIYNILHQAVAKRKITRLGDGEELREYIHVHDAARLSADVLSKEYVNQYVIITGNQQIKIKDLLAMVKEMLNNKVELEFLPARSSEHYEITPYNFVPKLARRIQGNHYVDLGQGIFDLLTQYHQEGHKEEGA